MPGKGHRATGMTTDGGFAEYAVHHASSLYRLPDNVSDEDAVMITTAGTGLYGLDVDRRLHRRPGRRGVRPRPGRADDRRRRATSSGANSVTLVGHPRDAGWRPGAGCGADHLVNARERDPVEAILELTDGDAASTWPSSAPAAVVAPQQCIAGDQARRQAPGRRVLPGPGRARPEPRSCATTSRCTRPAARAATTSSGPSRWPPAAACGRQELVTHHFPLDDIAEAFRVVRERDGDPLKVVLVP